MYPSSPNKYPTSPKAYPVSPKAFPGASAARWPNSSSNSTPLTIAGASLLRWAEVGMGSEVVSGGFVTNWNDLSVNGYNASAAAAQQPLYEIGGWNGQPSMAFDGGNDFFTIVAGYATALLGGSDTACTIWIACQFFITTDNVPFSLGNSAGTTPLFDFFASTTSGKFRISKNDGVNHTIDTTAASDKLRHVFKIKIFGTTAEIWKDGVLASAAAASFDAGSVTFNKARDGDLGRNTESLFFNGRMTAHVGVAGQLSAANETAMDAYMAKFLAAPSANMLSITGDSLSTAGKWPQYIAADFPTITVVNTASPGQTIFAYGLPNEFRDVTSNYDSNRPHTFVAAQWGYNDFVNARTGAQISADLVTYVNNLKTANPGMKVMVGTFHKRGGLSAGEETARTDANTAIVGNASPPWDYLLRRDLIITEDPTDTSVFLPDNTHLNPTGDGYIWNGRNGQTGIKGFMQAAGF